MENWGAAELRALFGGSADVAERQIMAGGQKLDVLFLDGLTSGGDIAEQVLRPLMQTVQPGSMQAVLAQAEQARVYCAVAERVTAPEDAADKLLHGYCAVVFPGTGAALCFETKTDTRRGPSAPESENTVKGAKDAFTETMRINTSLLRRHLRSAQLRFVQKTVGLRSQTAVTVCFLADLTDPALVRRMEQRLAAIDIDGMLTPASVEEYVTGSRKTAFPLLQYTERPDTFCQGLLNGQVGLLVDGLPLGYLAPVDLGILMKSTEDRAIDYISATCLRVLRYLALLAALLLPGLYVAMATYHQEMIPTKLLLAIIDSKQEVPFDTVFEVIGLLAAFELLQEAGLHLPLVFVYNPKLVGAEEITGWADLLRPELAGKIAFADPSVSGSSYTALVTMLCALPGETDEILQAFAENLDGKQLQSSGAVLTAVAGGQAVVGVTLEETVSRSIAAGDELVMVYPADGTSCVPDGCAILKGAPHEENAKLFVDFTVSLSVQKLLQERFCRRSVRGDLESTGTLPALSQIPQVDYDVGWASRSREALLMSWEFYLGTEAGA